jgi:hypothetical protein
LKVTYSEEAMNFEYLAVLLLPLEVRFANLFEVEICEVSEERVALLRAWDM